MRQAYGKDEYSAMGDTVEYFVLTSLGRSKTHIVRVLMDCNDYNKYTADYFADSRIFPRPPAQTTVQDVFNAYRLSDFIKKNSNLRDHFGLRRAGTLDEFVKKIQGGERT